MDEPKTSQKRPAMFFGKSTTATWNWPTEPPKATESRDVYVNGVKQKPA